MAFGLSQILNPFQGSGKSVYGSKVKVPTLPTLESAQKKAVSANTTNFADISKLAASTNTLNQEQLNRLIDMTLGPGVREQFQKNIASQARGEIPDDIASSAARRIAERTAGGNAFGGSFGRGSFTNHVTARDLDLTSLQISTNALSSAESWLNQAKAPMFDATRMFIDPAMQRNADIDQYNRDLMQAKIDAAPDPVARGNFDSNMAIIGMALSAYGGGPGYQGTYRPQEPQPMPQSNPYGGPNSYYAPSQFGNYASNFGGGGGDSYGGFANASQSAGVNNPYSLGGYNYGGGGGLAKMF